MSKARPAPIFFVYFFYSAFAAFAACLWTHGFMDARSYKEKGSPGTMTAFQLRGTRRAPKSPTYYRYLIELNGRSLESELMRKLVLGTSYAVLISPGDPDKFVIGTSQDSTLRIYASQTGGGFWGWVFIFIWPSIVIVCLVSLRQEIAARRIQQQRRYILPS